MGEMGAKSATGRVTRPVVLGFPRLGSFHGRRLGSPEPWEQRPDDTVVQASRAPFQERWETGDGGGRATTREGQWVRKWGVIQHS
jgi:hypothetical protein